MSHQIYDFFCMKYALGESFFNLKVCQMRCVTEMLQIYSLYAVGWCNVVVR